MPRPPGYISLPTPYEDLMMREEQRKMGTIRQPTDKEKLFAKYPWVKDAAVMGDEMLGIAAGGRIMQAIEDQKSIMLRPQNLYEFFDRNAGVVANLGEVGLSAIDMVGAAPMAKQGVKTGVKALNQALPGAGQYHLNPQGQLVPMEQAGVLRPSQIKSAREKGLLSERSEKTVKGLETWSDIHKQASKLIRPQKVNAHSLSKVMHENPGLMEQVQAAQKEFGVSVLGPDGNFDMTAMERILKGDDAFRDMPWAKELKPGHEKLPVYAGFNRSFTQKYVDNLPADEFEELRSSVIKSVEQDFADGKLANKNLKYVGKSSGMKDIYTGLMTAIRGAHKTEGVANLSTYCPMFNIGNHGCYLDGCYVSNLGKAAGGTNTYTNAMYAGEFLQFRDDVVELINEEIGGMRINGQGDLSMAQLPQVRDMFKHAAMRGLKLKMITKQDDTWEILYTLRNQKADPKAGITAKDAALIRSKAREIVLQPSIDPYWIPVKMDDLPGSGARAMGIPQTQAKVDAGQANVGALDRAVDIYKQMGVDAKVIDGQVYRKYGYSWDQIDALKEKFPGVNVQPRIVVSSPREIAEYALKMPDVLQTWMHAKLPKGMISDIDPDLASTALNFHRRAVIEQIGPGKWQIKAQINTKKGSKAAGMLKKDPKTGREYYGEGVQTSESSKAFQQLDAYIHANYAPDEVDQIYKALDGQLTEDGSALCCAGGASVKECFDCISFCHNGRHVTGARLGQMAKEYENLLPMAK
jgi:hypothetical protein